MDKPARDSTRLVMDPNERVGPCQIPASQIHRLSRDLFELATHDRIDPSPRGSAYGSPKAFLMWSAKS